MNISRYSIFTASPPQEPWHIYVHIPFCPRKCRFCMYYTIRSYSERTKEALSEAIVSDVRNYRALSGTVSHAVSSIYFGGGTPSELNAKRISQLVQELRYSFPIADDVEITLETFPDLDTASVLRTYADAGITRISIGVQSLDIAVLEASRRPTTGLSRISELVDACHSTGLCVNIDLMYGLPIQDKASCLTTLNTIIDARPDHITHYRCVNGPYSAAFRLREIEVFDRMTSEELMKVDDEARDLLINRGFHEYAADHYAISTKSITIHECGEWMGESVLGLGPAAMSFMGNTLFKNAPNLGSYRKSMDTGRVIKPITLNQSDTARRTAILCLTKLLKIDLSILQDRYGEDAKGVCEEILRLHDLGHVKKTAPNVYTPHRNDIALIIFELASFENSEMTRRVLTGAS